MEILLSFFAFIFAIIAWCPFLNNVYGHDIVSAIYSSDKNNKGETILYKDTVNASIGHFFHIMLLLKFWDKHNTKAFYGIMCVYCATSAFILFWVLSHLFGVLTAVLGSMLFSLYIVSPRLEGNWGPFEQLIPLPLFGSILCLLISSESHSYILVLFGGMLLGYAVLIKQIAAIYIPGYFLMMVGTGHPLFYHLTFSGGIILTNVIPLIYYWLKHNAFWEYLVSIWLFALPAAINPNKYNKLYPHNYIRGQKDSKAKKKYLIRYTHALFSLLFLSIIGATILFAYHFSLLYVGLFVCLISSVSTTFMRGTFFGHYWLNLVPWLAIFAGFGLSAVIKSSFSLGPNSAGTIAGILAALLLLVYEIRVNKKYYFLSNDPYQFLKRIGIEGLAECYKNWERIGEYIKNTTDPDNKILICGNAPHILLYSERAHLPSQYCLSTEDYFDIYNLENPNFLDFLNSIFRFKNLKIVKQRKNEFHEGYPELIVFAEGEIEIEGFEELTGIKYSLDEDAIGYPIFRADLELTKLMSIFEDKKNALQTECCDAEYLLQIGDTLIDAGKHKLLFNWFNRLIEKQLVPEPVTPQLLNKLGESYNDQNRHTDAENIFKKVLQINPNDATALNNIGVIYFSQNKKTEADSFFRRVLEIDPYHKDAIANLKFFG